MDSQLGWMKAFKKRLRRQTIKFADHGHRLRKDVPTPHAGTSQIKQLVVNDKGSVHGTLPQWPDCDEVVEPLSSETFAEIYAQLELQQHRLGEAGQSLLQISQMSYTPSEKLMSRVAELKRVENDPDYWVGCCAPYRRPIFTCADVIKLGPSKVPFDISSMMAQMEDFVDVVISQLIDATPQQMPELQNRESGPDPRQHWASCYMPITKPSSGAVMILINYLSYIHKYFVLAMMRWHIDQHPWNEGMAGLDLSEEAEPIPTCQEDAIQILNLFHAQSKLCDSVKDYGQSLDSFRGACFGKEAVSGNLSDEQQAIQMRTFAYAPSFLITKDSTASEWMAKLEQIQATIEITAKHYENAMAYYQLLHKHLVEPNLAELKSVVNS